MEKQLQWCDICVVCALPEEAEAFLEMLEKHYKAHSERKTYDHSKYDYWLATMKNEKDELLTLHITFPSRYGPHEMVSFLTRILDENQPRIVIMTGICAGDSQQVQLGDLVVAERTFTYDSGKFTQDERGKQIHLHDTLTYSVNEHILQFLGIFNTWKPLIARLKRPPSPSEQNTIVKASPPKYNHKITRHLKAMASGTAVRADNPFVDVRIPVRNAAAIDMEGAAVGLVMKKYPLVPWLIVKGVCDFADSNKTDSFHEYAAQASALYALSFIRAYVTNERLPRPGGPSPASRADSSGVWNVPYLRNPHFTGRDELLDRLYQQLTPAKHDDSAQIGRVALTQPQAIKGLGGIGKTQIAVEYAYRTREQGHYTHTLWVNAASEETIITSFVTIAELLPSFPAKNETDQRDLVKAIKRWLEQCKQAWLLIFDNVDDVSIVQGYLPQRGNGNILLTTRANAVGALATSIEVETMGLIEGTHLLLRRAQRFEQASDEDINQAGNIVVELDHFPLALDQAGAYIEETRCNFVDYLQAYQERRKVLLARRGTQTTNYPDSVATTWSLSFQKVEQANPAAAELLCLCAFLAPDTIPEKLIRDGATHWSSQLQRAVVDVFTFNQMLEELLKFSLVKRLTETQTLSIHRLVQATLIDTMNQDTQSQWAKRVVLAVNDIFPDGNNVTLWPVCQRYLPQVQACSALIERYSLMIIEAANLLNQSGIYMLHHALYTIAEPLILCALSIQERQLGPLHPDIATSLNNLAELYRGQGRYTEAEPLHRRALTIGEQQWGPSHPEIATSLSNLAVLYQRQERYIEAEPLYKRALSIQEQELGVDHLDTARSIGNLAVLYQDQKRYMEAEPLYKRALSIQEQQWGPSHPEIATSLNNLAVLYQHQGRYAEAEPLLVRALAIQEQQLGADHPDTAISLNNLAGLYKSQERYAEAEPLYKRALSIQEQRLGANHPDIAQSLYNLIDLYQIQDKDVEAEPLLMQAVSIRKQASGPDTALSLWSLAALYQQQQQYTQAEPLYQQALTILQRTLGPHHPSTKNLQEHYASLLEAMACNDKTQKRDN